MCLEKVDHHSIILRDNKMHLMRKARVGERICLSKLKLLQHTVHNGCSPPRIKKQALCLLVKSTPNTDNSITSRPPRFRSTALSFLARWAKRKFSYCLQFIVYLSCVQLLVLLKVQMVFSKLCRAKVVQKKSSFDSRQR